MTTAQRILARAAWEANVKAAYQESLGLQLPIAGPLTAFPAILRHWGVAVLREVAARRQDLVYSTGWRSKLSVWERVWKSRKEAA